MKLTLIPGPDRYLYLWLKAIRAVDLSQHCASVFVGAYHPDVDPKAVGEQVIEFEPDPDVVAYYLCGVARNGAPYRNAHLAMVSAPGERWSGMAGSDESHSEGSRLTVELEDGAPVFGWGPKSVPVDDPKAGVKAYATCRNYQFAHHLAKVRGLRSQPNPASFRRRHR